MEKIMIPPLDSNAAEVIKNNWAKLGRHCLIKSKVQCC